MACKHHIHNSPKSSNNTVKIRTEGTDFYPCPQHPLHLEFLSLVWFALMLSAQIGGCSLNHHHDNRGQDPFKPVSVPGSHYFGGPQCSHHMLKHTQEPTSNGFCLKKLYNSAFKKKIFFDCTVFVVHILDLGTCFFFKSQTFLRPLKISETPVIPSTYWRSRP